MAILTTTVPCPDHPEEVITTELDDETGKAKVTPCPKHGRETKEAATKK